MPRYASVIKELYDLQEYAIKLGLDNIRALMEYIGNPHLEYPVIHIAGTNGKGSTAFFIAQLLSASGLKTGLFTSPHLNDYRERVRIDNDLIDEKSIIAFWEKIKTIVLERKATFFDTTTAMALDYFNTNTVDVAVVETGLGGRLDSTNIVKPEICVITPIDFDHQKQLGNNLKSIAAEKAGIIKPGSKVIMADQEKDVEEEIVANLDATNKFLPLRDHLNIQIKSIDLGGTVFDLIDQKANKEFRNLEAGQIGDFQVNNIALAYIAAREMLEQKHREIDENVLKSIIKNSVWPGRLHRINQSPDIFFDVSHNLAGVTKTIQFLRRYVPTEKLNILTGLVQDKEYDQIAEVMANQCKAITVCEVDTHRRLAGQILYEEIKKTQKNVQLIKDAASAYKSTIMKLNEDETLLVIGSHYLIGSLFELI